MHLTRGAVIFTMVASVPAGICAIFGVLKLFAQKKLFDPCWYSVMVGGWFSQVTLVFCYGLNPKFCSFELDLDQAEQLNAPSFIY